MIRNTIEFKKETKKFILKVAKMNGTSLSKQSSLYLDEIVAQKKKEQAKKPEIIRSLNEQ